MIAWIIRAIQFYVFRKLSKNSMAILKLKMSSCFISDKCQWQINVEKSLTIYNTVILGQRNFYIIMLFHQEIHFKCTLNYIFKWNSYSSRNNKFKMNLVHGYTSLFHFIQPKQIRCLFRLHLCIYLLFVFAESVQLFFEWIYSVAKVRNNVLRVQRQWQRRWRQQRQQRRWFCIFSAC